MVPHPSLKLCNTSQVSIPKPADLYARVGKTKPSGPMSGDEVVPTNQNKVEVLKDLDKLMEKEE